MIISKYTQIWHHYAVYLNLIYQLYLNNKKKNVDEEEAEDRVKEMQRTGASSKWAARQKASIIDRKLCNCYNIREEPTYRKQILIGPERLSQK